MVEKSPYMPLYGKDIYTDVATVRLSLAHQGLYVRLLWWQWAEGSIPSDVQEVVKVLGKGREVSKLWPEIAPFFSEQTGETMRNPKLEDVRQKMVSLRQKRQDARNKRRTNTTTTGPTNTITKDPTNTLTNDGSALETATATATATAIVTAFDSLWSKYPRKIGSKAAERHFRSSVKTAADLVNIRRALENYLAHCATIEPRYIAHGSTWFNNWRDWLVTTESVRSAAKAGPDGLALVPDDAETVRRDEIREAARNHSRDSEWTDYIAWLAPDGTMRDDAATFDEWTTRKETA